MILLLFAVVDSLISLGDSLYYQDRFHTSGSFEYYNEALGHAEKLANQRATFKSLERIVNLYSLNDEEEENWSFYLNQLESYATSDSERAWLDYHKIRFQLQREYRKDNFDVNITINWDAGIRAAIIDSSIHLEIKYRGMYANYVELTEENMPKAIGLYKLNIERCYELDNESYDRYLFSNLVNLGNLYQGLGDYNQAIEYFKSGLALGDNPTAIYQNRIKVYGWISDTYKSMGKVDSALYYSELKYQTLNESDRLSHDNKMSELEEQYQNNVLTENLKTEQLRLSRNRLRLGFSVLIAGLLGYFFVLKRRENRLMRIHYKDELIKEKQEAEINAINARLDGEEQERIRVAQVLHDSIASQLTAADFQLAAMRATVSEERRDTLDKSMDLIKSTSSQVRDLSHELVPPALLKLGLVPAIEDLCLKYSNDQVIFHLNSGSEADVHTLNRDLKFKLYLIIQELMQNILKHSDATAVVISNRNVKAQLTLTIRDNASSPIEIDESAGLITIRTRISSLGGSFDIYRAKNETNNIQKIAIPYK